MKRGKSEGKINKRKGDKFLFFGPKRFREDVVAANQKGK